MIVGNGLIAKNLHPIDKKDILFFASGVSNSMCNDRDEYDREFDLLKKHINSNKKLVYFSSIDEYIVNEQYLNHKKKIEEFIKNNVDNFIIIKIPQLIGKNGNPNNFINHIYNNIKNNTEFDVFLTKRSLLDVEDLIKILNFLIKKKFNGVFDINYVELMYVNDFIKIIEDIVNKKVKIKNTIKIEQDIKKNSVFVETVLTKIIKEKKSYNLKIIKKYFNEKN
jgi:nucleoside-diphosphate-sugar epimerase